MSKINLLPEHIYNKIAAGEVVERPASVLKELLENALDAHSTKISVQIRKAGSEMISVTDDGEGMDPDDALLCFEAHATSKITNEDDLFSIRTMGFRGEALPSIASVSKITLRTRKRELPEGCEVILHGGKMISSKPAGCAPGTEVIVRDLFFNTPARKKFLRSRGTEEHHITEMMTNLALAHPELSFELKLDNRIILSTPGAQDLTPRIRELFGRDYAEAMLPLATEEHGISVQGYIAKRSFSRTTRLEQRIFVNSRPVDAPGIYRAIKEGCGPMLDKGRYLPCIIFISIDPALVDVNVHPAKREVRFSREFELVAAVRKAVANALRDSENTILTSPSATPLFGIRPPLREDEKPLSPEAMFDPEAVAPAPFDFSSVNAADLIPQRKTESFHTQSHGTGDAPAVSFALEPEKQVSYADPANRSVIESTMRKAFLDYTPQGMMEELKKASELPGFQEAEKEIVEKTPPPDRVPEIQPETTEKNQPGNNLGLRVIGILNNSYILAERYDGLIMIDQHAAHERVLFEKILKGVDGSLSQKLLIPVSLELSRAETVFVQKNAKTLEKLGFEAEPFGSNTVKLNAIPAAMNQDSAGKMFQDMLSNLTESGTPGGNINYEQVAMCACKAAVKANDELTMEEALSLLKQLSYCDLPFACPHGRPTILNISMKEIERRFGRR